MDDASSTQFYSFPSSRSASVEQSFETEDSSEIVSPSDHPLFQQNKSLNDLEQSPRSQTNQDIDCNEVLTTCQTQQNNPVCLSLLDRCKAFLSKKTEAIKNKLSPTKPKKPELVELKPLISGK